YIQAGPVLPASEALDAPWPKESTHKFSLLHDNRAVRDFEGGTFRLATVDEWPISKSMSGGVMTIKPGAMRKLHWNVNANEWHYYEASPVKRFFARASLSCFPRGPVSAFMA